MVYFCKELSFHFMPLWLIYALISTFFAGMTAVLAKYGLSKINSDLGVAIRTSMVFLFVIINAIAMRSFKDAEHLSFRDIIFLTLSGLTTSLSWIFYYRAIKIGAVSTVAAIDKGSIVITILLSFFFLREPLTPKLILGALLILSGMIVLVWK